MGFLNKILGTDKPLSIDTPAEAVNALAFMATVSNGQLTDERAELWMATAKRMKVMHGNSEKAFQAWMQKLDKIMEREGMDAAIEKSAAALPLHLKEVVYSICCDIIYEGTVPAENEKTYLRTIEAALGIEQSKAITIQSVISNKNSG